MGLLIRLAWLLVRDRSVNYEPINELTMPSRRGVAINVLTRDLDWEHCHTSKVTVLKTMKDIFTISLHFKKYSE